MCDEGFCGGVTCRIGNIRFATGPPGGAEPASGAGPPEMARNQVIKELAREGLAATFTLADGAADLAAFLAGGHGGEKAVSRGGQAQRQNAEKKLDVAFFLALALA